MLTNLARRLLPLVSTCQHRNQNLTASDISNLDNLTGENSTTVHNIVMKIYSSYYYQYTKARLSAPKNQVLIMISM